MGVSTQVSGRLADGPQWIRCLPKGVPDRSHHHGLLHYFKPKTQDFQQAFFSNTPRHRLAPKHPKRSVGLNSPKKQQGKGKRICNKRLKTTTQPRLQTHPMATPTHPRIGLWQVQFTKTIKPSLVYEALPRDFSSLFTRKTHRRGKYF
jgi:hypothetical protein